MNKVELKKMADGKLQEQFEQAFADVIENMTDPDTPYKNKREINIKMVFTQSEERDIYVADIAVKTKLAPSKGLRTMFSMTDKGVMEFNQAHISDYPEAAPDCDLETGEVKDGTVVDFQIAK